MGECITRCESNDQQPAFEEQQGIYSRIEYVQLPYESNVVKLSKDSRESEAEKQLIEELPSVLGSQSTSSNMLKGTSIKLFVIKPSEIANSNLIRRLDNQNNFEKDSLLWVETRFNSSSCIVKPSQAQQL